MTSHPRAPMRQAPSGHRWRERVVPALAALVLVAMLTATAPDLSDPPRQWVTLAVGQPGTLRDFSLRVTEVGQAAAIDVRGEPLVTTAVFVVVGVKADVLLAPATFARVQLQTRSGHLYEPRAEWIAAEPPLTQPGFTVRGSWVFEVPAARVVGTRLLVENEPREFDGYDRGLRIELGLDAPAPVDGTVRLADAFTRITR